MNLATMSDFLETNWLITSHYYYYSFRKYIHTYLFGWSIVLLLLMKIFEIMLMKTSLKGMLILSVYYILVLPKVFYV